MAENNVHDEILPPHPYLPYILDGIHDGIYEYSSWYWNRVNGFPYRSLFFFAWCANNLLRYRFVYHLTSYINFGHLFVRPFKYFHAMVVIGALSELETYRWEFSRQDPAARLVIGFLYRMRNVAAQEWPQDINFDDHEEQYYSEAYMSIHA